MTAFVDNSAWLAGYAAFEAGEGCPWGSQSARLGWIAAQLEQKFSEPLANPGCPAQDVSMPATDPRFALAVKIARRVIATDAASDRDVNLVSEYAYKLGIDVEDIYAAAERV